MLEDPLLLLLDGLVVCVALPCETGMTMPLNTSPPLDEDDDDDDDDDDEDDDEAAAAAEE